MSVNVSEVCRQIIKNQIARDKGKSDLDAQVADLVIATNNDPDLYNAIMGNSLQENCRRWINITRGLERSKTYGEIVPLTEAAMKAQAQVQKNALKNVSLTVATNLLTRITLRNGILLRDGTREDLEKTAEAQEQSAVTEMKRAKFLRIVARKLTDKKPTVGKRFTEDEIRELYLNVEKLPLNDNIGVA